MIEWFSDLEPNYDLYSEFSPWTAPVLADSSGLVSLVCSRRTGKTTMFAGMYAQEGLPGETHPYVAVTSSKAWDAILPIFERYRRTFPQFNFTTNGTKKTITTDRGVVVQCMGLSTLPEIEKLRSMRYPWVVFDECGAQNQEYLEKAVFSAAEPATFDFRGRGGKGIYCTGTPSYAPIGFWHDICGGNGDKEPLHGFTRHHASIFDNHHIPNAREELEKMVKQKKWTWETPIFVREYLGRFCLDAAGVCYSSWNKVVVNRTERPLFGQTIISIDFGESSPCAWNVGRIVEHEERIDNIIHTSMRVHVLESISKVCTSLHEIASITKQLQRTYSASYIVGDSAEGFGIRQLQQQYGLPIDPSKKTGRKAERIFMMSGMLQTGNIVIYEDCTPLINEMQTVPWNEDHDDHHEAYADHCCDSLHYLVERAMQLTGQRKAEPVPGTPEWEERRRAENRKRALSGR